MFRSSVSLLYISWKKMSNFVRVHCTCVLKLFVRTKKNCDHEQRWISFLSTDACISHNGKAIKMNKANSRIVQTLNDLDKVTCCICHCHLELE